MTNRLIVLYDRGSHWLMSSTSMSQERFNAAGIDAIILEYNIVKKLP